MKKVLILGGGRAQLSLIQTAKDMGLGTVVVGIEGKYPGYSLADEYYPVDIFNKDDVLKIAIKTKIDGVAIVCSDFGLSTVGYVCDKLNLCGISEYAAEMSSNKLKMKEQFEKCGVRTAKYRIIQNDIDVDKAIEVLTFPLIVKAVDLQGSRGIYICQDKQSLLNCYKLSIKESYVDYCIVEEFIEGEEFGAQAFVYNGQVIFVLPHGDLTLNLNSTQVPIVHYAPYIENNFQLLNEVELLCKHAIKALSLDNCAVNVDLIIKDGIPYVIEVAGRAGANCLPELVSAVLGLNYYEMILMTAIGDNPQEYFESGKRFGGTVMTKMLFSKNSGIVKTITYPSNIHMFVKEGDEIRKFQNSRDYIGEIIVQGHSFEECERQIKDRTDNINIQYEEITIK